MAFNRRNSAATPIRMPNTSTMASQGARAKVEVTTRNSLMKMPSGGNPAIATTPSIVLVFGILIGVAALFLRLNAIAFGEPRGPTAEAKASYVPMSAHLALVFVAGIYMPPALVAWFQNVAKLLG